MTDLSWIQRCVREGLFRFTLHAQSELANDGFTVDDVVLAVASATVLEDYPDAQRGPCCLLSGLASAERFMHLVITTAGEVPVVITVYEPLPPKWITPSQRRPKT